MTVDNFLIWSVEHDAWWGPNHHGYVRHVSEAGVYSRVEAEEIRDRAYIGWTRDTDPPEVLVPAFVGVSPTMATLAAAAVETARAGWAARDAIATRELDVDTAADPPRTPAMRIRRTLREVNGDLRTSDPDLFAAGVRFVVEIVCRECKTETRWTAGDVVACPACSAHAAGMYCGDRLCGPCSFDRVSGRFGGVS